MINEVLPDYLNTFVIAFIDNILIYSPDITSHVEHMSGSNGVFTDKQSHSCDAMVYCELQWFLGFANFYRCFIRNYSTDSALKGLKLAFTTAPNLKHPNCLLSSRCIRDWSRSCFITNVRRKAKNVSHCFLLS